MIDRAGGATRNAHLSLRFLLERRLRLSRSSEQRNLLRIFHYLRVSVTDRETTTQGIAEISQIVSYSKPLRVLGGYSSIPAAMAGDLDGIWLSRTVTGS